jgi:hypothetical protein
MPNLRGVHEVFCVKRMATKMVGNIQGAWQKGAEVVEFRTTKSLQQRTCKQLIAST